MWWCNMSVMAERKPKRESRAPEVTGKPANISYRPSREVAAAMRDYRARAEVPPDKSKVIEIAMREFFRARGYDMPERPEGD